MKDGILRYSEKERSEKAHFDKLAENYDLNYGYNDKFTKYKVAKKASYLVDLIKQYCLDSGSTILEFGCGTGVYTREVSKRLPLSKIEAIDISINIIDVARKASKKYKNIKYRVASIFDTGLKAGSVDIIFGFYVLHHLDQRRTVKEITRILKPGGIVFFYEPNLLNPWVFIVKSTPFIKKIMGDSPEEWAINPLSVRKRWKGFDILDNSTSEFVLPVNLLSQNVKILIDKTTGLFFSKLPFFKLFGGSVRMVLRKKLGDNLELKYKTERVFYDNWASNIKFKDINYLGAFEANTAIENRFALLQFGDLRNKRILDLGSGMGDASIYFALKGAKVNSIDISSKMVNIVNRMAKKNGVKSNIKADVMVAEDLKFKSNTFDFVFGNGVLHHVIPRLALHEVHRVLKKGGTATFIEPLGHNPVINIYRSVADKVRTPTEVPLKYNTLDSLTDAKFITRQHQEFHFTTLLIFLWFYFIEGINPNRERYWKKIINDSEKIKIPFTVLSSIDKFLLKVFPFLRKFCWNTVLVYKK